MFNKAEYFTTQFIEDFWGVIKQESLIKTLVINNLFNLTFYSLFRHQENGTETPSSLIKVIFPAKGYLINMKSFNMEWGLLLIKKKPAILLLGVRSDFINRMRDQVLYEKCFHCSYFIGNSQDFWNCELETEEKQIRNIFCYLNNIAI